MDKGIRTRSGWLGPRVRSALGLLAFGLLFSAQPLFAQTGGAKSDTEKTCIECHEEQLGIEHTKHYVRSDPRTPLGTGKECDACHGDTRAHKREPRKPGLIPVSFRKGAPVEPQNAACLACHERGARIHWQGSPHDRTKTACASCHSGHAKRDQVLIPETQAGVCFTCHQDRRAEMYRLSSHPMRTGALPCSGCHQPHGTGSGRALLARNGVNETCYTCHADKRGPFLWEHPSAKDDCTHCHNPHGSNNPPMLKVRMPYLCQQCHVNAQHPSTLWSGNQLPPNAVNAAAQMVGRQCANCHIKVHGSNHPSGPRLMR
jgi:DmsE family decaheme c-type cytochrome